MKWLWGGFLVLCVAGLIVSYVNTGEINDIALIWANIAFLWIKVSIFEEKTEKTKERVIK